MNIITSNIDFELYQNIEYPTIYTISFNSYSKPLIQSILYTKNIYGPTVLEDYKSISFKASDVKTYTQYEAFLLSNNKTRRVSYDVALRIIYSLSNQISYLLKVQNKCFYAFNPQNILVIDNNKFIYVSNEHLLNYNPEKNSICFTCPFNKDNGFYSPEVLSINTIPHEINYTNIYYSLASFVIYVLFESKVVINSNNIDNILIEIKDTKLYWLLKRCLLEIPKERKLCFI